MKFLLKNGKRFIENEGKELEFRGSFHEIVQAGDTFDDYDEKGNKVLKQVIEKRVTDDGIILVSTSIGVVENV